MKKLSLALVLTAMLASSAPVLAQRSDAVPPPRPSAPTTTTVVLKAPPLTPAGSNAPVSRECTPCDKGGRSSGYYNAAGYPQYPGPNAPLPAQGSYYANPYDYYDNYNPNNPYGYYQNGGYYNPGYYSSGYSSGSPGYSTNPSNSRPSNGSNSFPSFQGYETRRRR